MTEKHNGLEQSAAGDAGHGVAQAGETHVPEESGLQQGREPAATPQSSAMGREQDHTGPEAGAADHHSGENNAAPQDSPITGGGFAPPPPPDPAKLLPRPWEPLARFTGRGDSLLGLYLANIFLSLLTFGIYSFWGRTNIRRYMWRNTLVLDSPLEYTGTGKELFLSYLIVLPLLILGVYLFGLALREVDVMFEPLAVTAFFPLVMMFLVIGLVNFAVYRAMRYRLTRTRWRGIRCNLGGSALVYGFWATVYTLAAIFSYFILVPWAISKMAHRIANNIYIGDTKVEFSAQTKTLYIPYIFLIGLMFGGLALFFSLILYGTGNDFYYWGYYGGWDALDWLFYLYSFQLVAVVVGLVLLYYLARTYFDAALTRWFYAGLSAGPMRSRSRISTRLLLPLRLTNLLLIICTLGFGLAWARVREMRLQTRCLEKNGTLAFESLGQDAQSAPKFGEGLLEALGISF